MSIQLKSPAEIAKLREANLIVADVLDTFADAIHKGAEHQLSVALGTHTSVEDHQWRAELAVYTTGYTLWVAGGYVGEHRPGPAPKRPEPPAPTAPEPGVLQPSYVMKGREQPAQTVAELIAEYEADYGPLGGEEDDEDAA